MTLRNSRHRFSDGVARRAIDPVSHSLAPWMALGSVSMLSAAAYWLGAEWLGESALGLPAGAWAAMLAAGLVNLSNRPRQVTYTEEYLRTMGHAGRTLGAGLRRVRRGMGAAAARLAPLTAGAVERINGEWGERFSAWLDERAQRASIRVLDQTGLACRAPGPSKARGSEWSSAGTRDSFDAELCRSPDGRLCASTPVRPGRDAAWFDWSCRCPLSFGSIFPGRIDPERVTLDDGDRAAESMPRLVAALVDAAAATARHPDRLDLSDRLRGRTPIAFETPGLYMRRLAELTAEYGAGRTFGPTLRTAARVSSAWLLRAPIEEGARSRLLEAAGRIAGDEPEVMLRVAAARFASYQDDAGLDALLRADRMLRCEPTLPGADPALFIQSEFGTGANSPVSVGRVAAGICLLCAAAPAEKLAFIRDDLFDDMRYAGLLVGMDQERTLLIEVFRALEKARRAEIFALPPARAA